MNKKGIEISLNIIIVSAIGLLVLVVLSVIFLTRIQPLNPETDVCTEWKEWDVKGVEMFKKEYPNSICEPESEWQGRYVTICKECLEWRSKTPEELKIDYCNANPTNQTACVCDEHTKKPMYNTTGCSVSDCSSYPYEYKFCVTGCKNPKQIISYVNLTCISAHPKSECEKGNPKYVKDLKVYCGGIETDVDDELFNLSINESVTIQGKCNTNVQPVLTEFKAICRPKTIQDYSCEELLGKILRDEFYDKQDNVWRKNIWNCKDKEWCIDPMDVFEEKGCNL